MLIKPIFLPSSVPEFTVWADWWNTHLRQVTREGPPLCITCGFMNALNALQHAIPPCSKSYERHLVLVNWSLIGSECW